jgi:hypothetical protein
MGALSSLATLGLNVALGQQADRRERRAIRQERDRQVETIRARDAEEERERQARLREAVARERARLAAAGLRGPAGSAEAVLRGLTEESELARRASRTESDRRVDEITRQARDRRRRSLLDLGGTLTRSAFGSRGTGGSLLDL